MSAPGAKRPRQSGLVHVGGHAAGALSASPVEFAAAFVACSPDCIKILTLDGMLVFMSENGRCAMEIDAFELVAGTYWPDLWPEAERPKVTEAIARSLSGEVVKFQGSCPTAKQSMRSWDVTVSPIRNDDGEIVALLSISRDITAALPN